MGYELGSENSFHTNLYGPRLYAGVQHSLLSTLDDQNHDNSSRLLSYPLAWESVVARLIWRHGVYVKPTVRHQ